MNRIEQTQELRAAVADGASVVLFHSTWCPFCRTFRPIFQGATQHSPLEPIEVVIDDEASPLWTEYSIEIVPTVLFFDKGRVVHRLDGRPGMGIHKAALLASLARPLEPR